MTTIVWFRQDLRTADNPALIEAARAGKVLPVFILDETAGTAPRPAIGAASKWWLHHSLVALEKSLGRLVYLRGDPLEIVPRLSKNIGAARVFWNRCYEPHAVARDRKLKASLIEGGIETRSFNAALLNEPWEIVTGGGEPYKVFSPYWRACRQRPFADPEPAPEIARADERVKSERLADWKLLPSQPDWAAGWERIWRPGEAGAQMRLAEFLDGGVDGYRDKRNRPDQEHVSRLSPHLHWGEISPRQVVAAAEKAARSGAAANEDVTKFLAEIGWREFAHHLLFAFPGLATKNWKPAFDAYPWRTAPDELKAWQRGMTGYPMVDAGMRQLWRTGWMHNRVRMVTASFLIKHLQIDWRQGEAWFWDTLLDADMANNAAGWQWVAGSGADAAPYFRIFNPVAQGEKFDPEGGYVRRWCPELARLPDKFLHAPFLAPPEILKAARVELGVTYPKPIVDHAEARARALAGYGGVKAKVGAEAEATAAQTTRYRD